MNDKIKVIGNDFVNAAKTCLRKYATFTGRARRSEFWYFQLMYFVTSTIAKLLDGAIFSTLPIQPLDTLVFLALVVPCMAVGARRLHDIDKSGWWQLLVFTIIGLVPLIYWFCKKGHTGDNRFGANPLDHAPITDGNG